MNLKPAMALATVILIALPNAALATSAAGKRYQECKTLVKQTVGEDVRVKLQRMTVSKVKVRVRQRDMPARVLTCKFNEGEGVQLVDRNGERVDQVAMAK